MTTTQYICLVIVNIMKCIHSREVETIYSHRYPLISCTYYWNNPYQIVTSDESYMEYMEISVAMKDSFLYVKNFPYDFDFRFYCGENCKHYKE